MGARAARRVALLAIHPGYAEAILDGRKQVEFRKRALAPDVERVVMYATAPVQRLVGEFVIDAIDVGPPESLWALHGPVGAIDAAAFAAYYAGSTVATGILVTAPRRYRRPVRLRELDPTPAVPQSFSYLDAGLISVVHELSGGVRQVEARAGGGRATPAA